MFIFLLLGCGAQMRLIDSMASRAKPMEQTRPRQSEKALSQALLLGAVYPRKPARAKTADMAVKRRTKKTRRYVGSDIVCDF